MGPEAAVNIVFRREISRAPDPEATRSQLVAEYREKFANPYIAANRGYVDAVIEPARDPATRHQRPGNVAEQARHESAEETQQHTPLSTLR